jgi:hypothetical protein
VAVSIAPPYWNDANINSSRWKRHFGRPEGLYQNHARRFFDCALMGNGDRVPLVECVGPNLYVFQFQIDGIHRVVAFAS